MESATRCCPSAAFSAPFMTKVGDGDREYEHVIVVPLAEYRELCGKAALWDEYRADVERWTGGEADA